MAAVDGDFHLHSLFANGISHRVATVRGNTPHLSESLVASTEVEASPLCRGPLVMLLHGWPESWYCWRHQLRALSAARIPVCAPDMRGYGGTDAPENILDYKIDTLCQDVLQIALGFGYRKIFLVGHDFGAYLAWIMALRYPGNVVAVCGMSVPYLGHTPRNEPHMARLQQLYGNCLPQAPYSATPQQQEVANFHYMLHHNLKGVENEYNGNMEEALFRIYSYSPGVACHVETPEVRDRRMFPLNHRKTGELDARSAPGLWLRIPRPLHLPKFMSKEDFAYILQQYQECEFGGGLKWYQALDQNWFLTQDTKEMKITQPALFICGGGDRNVLNNHGGLTHVMTDIKNHFVQLKGIILIEGAGHWIQQECPDEVNKYLRDFIESVSTGANDRIASRL